MIGIREYAWPQENVLIDIHEGYVAMDRKKALQEQIITPKNAKMRHLKIYDCVMLVFLIKTTAVHNFHHVYYDISLFKYIYIPTSFQG